LVCKILRRRLGPTFESYKGRILAQPKEVCFSRQKGLKLRGQPQ
jgi:hypothetical protein